MGCTLFWMKFGSAFAYFTVLCLQTRWRYYSIKISILIARPDSASWFLASMRKYIFAQERFYLHCILNDINEQDTSFLDCKHKHMMKSGAPPDKFGVLHHMFTY